MRLLDGHRPRTRRSAASRGRGGRRLALASTVLALAFAAPASRAADAADEADAEWVGRYCTPLGCSGTLGSAAANAASFGAAAGAVLLLARRRRA